MIDTEVLYSVAKTGAGFAVFAAVLYLFTSDEEPRGFRVFPASAREWIGYWFRTLELTLAACMLLGLCRGVTAVVLIVVAFIASFVFLAASSIIFWRSDRDLSISGVCFLVLAALYVFMYPARAAS
ncbi:MAG: hypothetical protein M3463_05375 [Verrucomicrobiota bacterium]|nr:hypothetical protein [Verrucomicrobiota bacterium]